MRPHTLLLVKRLGITLALVFVAVVATACSEDGARESPKPPPSLSPTPKAEIPNFPRLAGVTTARVYASSGDAGIQHWQRDVPRIEDVRIASTVDDYEQPALWLPPRGDGPQPLLVVVHSWSTDYLHHLGIPLAEWAEESGWGMISPDFRGVNDNPDATGSDLAVQDVMDAVDFAAENAEIDEDHVYIIGFSGGGMMSLLMAGRHPDRFAGAVAWVPIHDLAAWYEYNVQGQRRLNYPGHIRSSCGGDPTIGDAARAECQHRSPSAYLDVARYSGMPVYLGHGLNDKTVPPVHALWTFNQLVGEGEYLDEELLEAVAQNRLPDELEGSVEAETYFSGDDPDVLFSRQAGKITLVLFEGEHDMVYNPGLEWMWQLAYSDGVD